MIGSFGKDVVQAYMGHVQDNAEEAVRRAVGALSNGEFVCSTDHGAQVRVNVQVDQSRGQARIDFDGTSSQRGDNFNAPRAICQGSYCLP
jgi:5-oxoprolinase (ATP-hydrolysing)